MKQTESVKTRQQNEKRLSIVNGHSEGLPGNRGSSLVVNPQSFLKGEWKRYDIIRVLCLTVGNIQAAIIFMLHSGYYHARLPC